MSKTIKVALYEDNNHLRDSLSKLIYAYRDLEFVGSFANALSIIENCEEKMPDVILMDIDMPGINGIEAVKLVRKKFPEIKVLMQTVFDDDEKVFQSICAGAVGYMLKKTSPTDLMDGIREAHFGGAPITPSIAVKVLAMFRKQAAPVKNEEINLSERESEILLHLTKGLSYKLIADACNISIDTVRFHIKNIYEKLHVHSMTEAVSKAIKDKLV